MDAEQPARRKIRWQHWLFGAVFGIGLIGLLASCENGKTAPTRPSNQTYASPTSTPVPFPTPDRKPTPKTLTDKDCLRSADCFSKRKDQYRTQARDGCWVQIEIAIINADLIEHTRYVGGDLPTLRYFGKEPPGNNTALWLIDIEVQEGSTWEQATVECLYDHVNERVVSTQVW